MNKIFKCIWNAALGVWVAVSELAKGRTKSNKTASLALASTLISMGVCVPLLAHSAQVYDSYTSGTLILDANGDATGVDPSNSANYKGKNQNFSSGTTEFELNNSVTWLPATNGPAANFPVTSVGANALAALGALTITQSGSAVGYPTFNDWDLGVTGGKSTVTITNSDNTTSQGWIYDIDAVSVQHTMQDVMPSFSAQVINGQPTQPFVDLRIATVTGSGSVLNLTAPENIDWNPGQVKQSSLFAAENGATLNQNSAIKVTFSGTDSVSAPVDSSIQTGSFGPSKKLSGAQVSYGGTTYSLDSVMNVKAFNAALAVDLENGTLTQQEYQTQIEKAWVSGDQVYTYTYDPSKLNYGGDYYFSSEMQAGIGKRAIFEASGLGTIINLNQNVAAIGQYWARAYNIWAHDSATVNNNGAVQVQSQNTQNALIESGAKYINTTNGILNFGLDENGKNFTNWADQVAGVGSTYTNQGTISIANSPLNDSSAGAIYPNAYAKLSRNIATEVSNGASAVNSGSYVIGSTAGLSGSQGTATGVHINGNGSFSNSGTMTVQAAYGGGSDLKVNNANNAVSALADDTTTGISVSNSGHISVSGVNGAGINIGVADGVTGTVSGVTATNVGTIDVSGTNSTGLKASGPIKQAGNTVSNAGTINVSSAGSSGIWADTGAEIANAGAVTVNGSASQTGRTYGIRASGDGSKVTLQNGSALTLDGSYATGLYATAGAGIEVAGGSINVVNDPAATQQTVFWISGKNGSNGASSSITFDNDTDFTLQNQSSTLFRVDQGATYDGSSSKLKTVNVAGANSNGYTIANNGTTFTSGPTEINVTGNGATGLNVNSGAGLDGHVILSADTVINVTGSKATIATVDGNTYDVMGNQTGQEGAKLISNATLTATGGNVTVGADAIGYKVVNKGELVQNGTIDFSHALNATGVYIDGGTLTNQGAIASNGIGIDVYQTGANSSQITSTAAVAAVDGTAAIRLNNNASLTAGGAGVISGSGTADAIRVMAGGKLATDNAHIAVDGSGSGIHFMNTAADAAGTTFTLTGTGTIAVSGNSAAGITLEGQDASGGPTMSNANMDTRGSENLVINVADAGGNGIVTNTSGYVYSGTSVNIASAQGQSALVVKGTTTEVQQTGTLTSDSDTSAVVDLTQRTAGSGDLSFTNSGEILANGAAAGVQAGDGSYTISNTASGQIKGGIVVGNGNNTVNLDGSSQTDKVILGNGTNTVNIQGGTTNGELSSGSGSDSYNLIAVAEGQSDAAFSSIDGGDGKDTLTAMTGSHYVLDDPSKIKNIEKLAVTGNSTFEVKNVDLALQSITGDPDTNVVQVDAGSTYFINFDAASSGYVLNQDIQGAGTIKTSTNGQSFDFGNADYMKSNFTGVLALGNGKFQLAGDNTTALAQSTLQLDASGVATLPADQGMQTIYGLAFNGGTLNVAKDFIGSKEDALNSQLTVTHLDVSGAGTVHLTTSGFDNDYVNDQLADVSKKTLLDQDDGNNLVKVVTATGSVTGNGSGLDVLVLDQNGNLVGTQSQQAIRQSGEVVAQGTYDVGSSLVSSGSDMGLYAAYQLKSVNIQDGKTLNLESVQGATGTSLDLKAQLTGSGNIEVNALGDYLSLSNSSNDFTGTTTVNAGVLKLAADSVLGQQGSHTSELILKGGAAAQLGSTTQYVGALESQSGATLSLDSGTLNIDRGGVSNGAVTSSVAGTLNVNGGTLDVNGANAEDHGTTNVASGASVNITHTQGLGDGVINLDGALNVNGAAGSLFNALKKSGQANIARGSDVTLAGDNSGFSGTFNVDEASSLRASVQQHLGTANVVNAGALYLTQGDDNATWTVDNSITGAGNVFKLGSGVLELTASSAAYTGATWVDAGTLLAGSDSTPVALQSRELNIGSGATFAGYGSTAGDVNNEGTFVVGGLNKVSQAAATSYTVLGSFNNAGSIVLGSQSGTGSTLLVNGNYVSNGGSLYLNSVLNEGFAQTQTDQLIVGNNVQTGTGGATTVHVKPVGGQGAYTQPDAIKIVDVGGSTSSDAFRLSSPVVIGVYEYRLSKGTKDNSWYLSSYNPAFPPDENQNIPDLRYVNPQIGAYMANQYALGMFNLTLHDRLGEPQYADSLKQPGAKASSLWARVQANDERFNLVDDQLRISGQNQILQIGGDLIRWSGDGAERGRMGLMAAYGHRDMDSVSQRTGARANASINEAYSVGAYGTLYQDAQNPLGSYVDVWGLYNWYKNEVGMTGYQTARYDSHGYNLSVEAGHTFVLSESADKARQWQLQPQAQLIYGHLQSNGSVNESGLTLGSHGFDSLESRLGARLTYVPQSHQTRQIQPFVELNWYHQFKDNNTLTFNDAFTFNSESTANRLETKVGVEVRLDNNWNGWANASYMAGSAGYRQVRGMLGVKYQW